jgi:hypothetical protein
VDYILAEIAERVEKHHIREFLAFGPISGYEVASSYDFVRWLPPRGACGYPPTLGGAGRRGRQAEWGNEHGVGHVPRGEGIECRRHSRLMSLPCRPGEWRTEVWGPAPVPRRLRFLAQFILPVEFRPRGLAHVRSPRHGRIRRSVVAESHDHFHETHLKNTHQTYSAVRLAGVSCVLPWQRAYAASTSVWLGALVAQILRKVRTPVGPHRIHCRG